MSTKKRRAYQREAMSSLYQRRKKAGLCPLCGAPKGPTTVTCESHAACDRAKHRKEKV